MEWPQLPSASFVIPCYNLGHLLAECVDSILSQTYQDFEILIMDDCSPDDTAEVAATFADPRVRYFRNERNLGHLRNYNKGIALAAGRYVLLISADDRLRSPHLLERYVHILDDNPAVGYVCCPGMRLENGIETEVEGCLADHDMVLEGKAFLFKLLRGNFIIAASGMVRRVCYEKHGAFPLDLPYAGDWFLWCLFAVYYNVAYCAEPMVNYRRHELSMTNYLMSQRRRLTLKEGFVVLWRIETEARRLGDTEMIKECHRRLTSLYASHLVGWEIDGSRYCISVLELENSLHEQALTPAEKKWIQARIWTLAGDRSLRLRNVSAAREYYVRALLCDRRSVSLRARRLLTRTGNRGVAVAVMAADLGRAATAYFRHNAARG
jgi:glycosyltransferase involved in cell wall biosynthesis